MSPKAEKPANQIQLFLYGKKKKLCPIQNSREGWQLASVSVKNILAG